MKTWLVAVTTAPWITLAGALVTAPAAEAVTATQCIDAHANPQGTVAQQCRNAGWTVNSVIVVDPGGWVRWHNLRECRDEWGSTLRPCSWNFGAPPSAGAKYWVDWGGHINYVQGINWGP